MKKIIIIIGLCLGIVGGLQSTSQARIGYRGCAPFWGTATVSRFQEGSMWELRCSYGNTSASVYELQGDSWVYLGGGYFATTASTIYVPWTPLPMKVLLYNNGCSKEVRF